MMGALRGCHAVNFLLSSIHTILVIVLRYVRLNVKQNIILYLPTDLGFASCILHTSFQSYCPSASVVQNLSCFCCPSVPVKFHLVFVAFFILLPPLTVTIP